MVEAEHACCHCGKGVSSGIAGASLPDLVFCDPTCMASWQDVEIGKLRSVSRAVGDHPSGVVAVWYFGHLPGPSCDSFQDGSNGERDYMRGIARTALEAH